MGNWTDLVFCLQLAAEKTGALPENSVAVEDSTSGVGSAANAQMGLIVGYVGGSHIAPENEDGHAGTLMAGERSDDKRGADITICLLYTSPSPRDVEESRMPSSA